MIFAASTIGTLPNTMEGTIENFSAQPNIVTFTFANGGTVPFTIQPLSSFSFTFANVAQISVAGTTVDTYNGNFNFCIRYTSI
ncbi:S-Ena type endospore appendage [Peribacillus butanolivorans]|uniref:S-Ena type endospore appendage n=1 Tax=Peribacillus butanolivorans TaxID=421767 RepID=UPI003BF4CE06